MHALKRLCVYGLPVVGLIVCGIASAAYIVATPNDVFQPGTQPDTLNTFMIDVVGCANCHGFYDPNAEPYYRWVNSMMAQAARDPIFYACLTIANQDVEGVGDICIRCHAPVAWLEGRSSPPDGSAFIQKDFEGITCHFCHRLVDPVADPNNPPDDAAILAALPAVNPNPHTGQYVVDPNDLRRGPRNLPDFFLHPTVESPFHKESLLCANCHDVSNPLFTRQPDGTYALGPLDAPHPTHDKFDEFPIERTYSEWSMSSFAQGPIDMGGRFGGNDPLVSSCQDCHMPKTEGWACIINQGDPDTLRTDLVQHNFNGSNSWVLSAVRDIYPDWETGLTAQSVMEAQARNVAMLQAASDMELSTDNGDVIVRVINQTGHKLPTGYAEGRRMWLNVRFYDSQDQLIAEAGAYDPNSAVLDDVSTKVYEGKPGLDMDMAQLTGLPLGPSFHFVMNNKWYLDNRIPPRGFTNANFEAIQAAPVGYSYADGQYWDDTAFTMPAGTQRVEARLYHQTTTKEYIEFLLNENTTDNRGTVAYNLWEQNGKSAPVEMDYQELTIGIPGDFDGDGDVDLSDLGILLGCWGQPCGDLTGDGDTGLGDLGILLGNWS